MTTLTDKQKKFASNKALGVTNREAAIAAGYSPNGASVAATNLMRRPDIKAAIKSALNATQSPSDVVSVGSGSKMPKTHYTDPMEFLEDVMNHRDLSLSLRVDAAKQLLPYRHPRIGELGKKEKRQDAAREAMDGRFAPKQAPKLGVIRGGKE